MKTANKTPHRLINEKSPRDDKILTVWNALMIAALAMGARVLDHSVYLSAAEKAVFNHLRGALIWRLLARYRDGESAYLAYLDDYAFLVWSLIELYKTTYRPSYLEKAMDVNSRMLTLFWDEGRGGFFMTDEDAEELLTRTKEIYDGAVPSGNSVAAMNLLQLAGLTGESQLEEKAEQLFSAFGGDVRYVSPDTSDIRETVSFLQEYKAVDGHAAAYVCENQTCQAPLTSVEELKQALEVSSV